MPNTPEGAPAPKSVVEEAIAELEKEGHTIEGKEPAPDPVPKEEPKAPEAPKEPQAPKEPEPPKPARTPTMVEAWKLKVAEDQKAGLEKDLTDLKKQVEDLSRQKGPVTADQKNEIQDEIKAIAEKAGVDAGFLTEFADTILKKANAGRPSGDVEKTLKSLQEERELEKQFNAYSSEFEADVVPLIKDYNLSGDALKELKQTLRDYAFSETYAKVPLKEIFRIKEESFALKAPKKSSESKGVKSRASDIVDLDNITEEDFAKLSPEQAEALSKTKSSGGWASPKK